MVKLENQPQITEIGMGTYKIKNFDPLTFVKYLDDQIFSLLKAINSMQY